MKTWWWTLTINCSSVFWNIWEIASGNPALGHNEQLPEVIFFIFSMWPMQKQVQEWVFFAYIRVLDINGAYLRTSCWMIALECAQRCIYHVGPMNMQEFSVQNHYKYRKDGFKFTKSKSDAMPSTTFKTSHLAPFLPMLPCFTLNRPIYCDDCVR